jgi:hypothetical protein
MESHGGMILTGKNRSTPRKNCPCATLSTTNPTWTDPGLLGGRLETNRLSHGHGLYEILFRISALEGFFGTTSAKNYMRLKFIGTGYY